MTLPKHRNPPIGRAARAPYNFVPVPDTVADGEPSVRRDAFDPHRHTGRIEVTLRAETPLYVRAGIHPEQVRQDPDVDEERGKLSQEMWAHWDQQVPGYPDFFHHGDPTRPVIPGSEVRGLIRSLVTIMSGSALPSAPGELPLMRDLFGTSRRARQYRVRFTGVNQNGNAFGQKPAQLSYPSRTAAPNNPNRPYAVRGGFLFRDQEGWYIIPGKALADDVTIVHVAVDTYGAVIRLVRVGGERRIWCEAGPLGGVALEHSVATQVSLEEDPGLSPAWLVRVFHPGPDHFQPAVLEPDWAQSAPIEVPREMRERYENDRDKVARDPDQERRVLLHKDLPHRVRDAENAPPAEVNLKPCFYLTDAEQKLVFFGPTMFFRIPTRSTPAELMPVRGPQPDFAERLFGRVSSTQNEPAIASRVFFGSLTADLPADASFPALPHDATERDGYVSFSEQLLAPKPEAAQMYLVQPEADANEATLNLRTYDDALDGGVDARPGQPLVPVATTLRGFKHYWHRPTAWSGILCQPSAHDADARKTHLVIRPVAPSTEFRGTIRFENLTDAELGSLLRALRLAPNQRHRIGLARPFGFGSVKVTVDRVCTLEHAVRYGSFFKRDAIEAAAGWRLRTNDELVTFETAFARWLERSTSPDHADRMAELDAMLRWAEPPPADATATAGQGHAQWTERWVLPTPRRVLDEDG